MENRNPGLSRKNGASPIRLIIRRLPKTRNALKTWKSTWRFCCVMIAYQPERSDQRVCLHVSDGGSVWNKVKRLLNGKYNTNTNTNGKYKCDKLSCQTSWRNGADPVWRVVQADWRFDQQVFFEDFLLFKGLTNKRFLKIFFFLKVWPTSFFLKIFFLLVKGLTNKSFFEDFLSSF